MATNPGFEYQRAEEEYRDADTPEEKLKFLQKMLRTAPKHKSAGNLLASIKERIAKGRSELESYNSVSLCDGNGVNRIIKRMTFILEDSPEQNITENA